MFDECSDTTARRSPIRTPAQGRKDRHRLSGLLSGRGSAPPCDQARQPILPAILVVAEPAITNVAAHYPLVVTQYASRGFLRGQVGNEYPMYPLAAAGFVVLSIDWTRFTNFEQSHTPAEWNAMFAQKGRELVWSGIRRGIDELIAAGLVDPAKMALTGLSGGAENVHFVLQRDDRFAAAIASSAAADLTFFALASEDGDRERLMKTFNSPTVIPQPGSKIYDLAWSNKPEKLVTPLLINVGEYEALIGFEGISAIKTIGGPLEVRIFPGEQHLKYHPRAILGVYENNLQWLQFWLMNKEDPAPEFSEQYQRWREMRARLDRK
ncbi:hypothetical protein CAF53_02345 [Sphingobium sp. LB126]|uniref:prolyl oligopeptidase family serine peptidase n=1 Tax=Sphingobium sp. LB126 TaxID=1983755 RepID=UPI000C20CB83|nr:prolyl oligopeptidase family serine peptidase [Sphingobium sp. LB126]PJG47207.1 hypothetical protein CAF53_02345 [Sphingobium sp. LB126]